MKVWGHIILNSILRKYLPATNHSHLLRCSIFLMMLKTAFMSTVFQMMRQSVKSIVLICLILDIFRPYPGFQQIRLIRKTTSTGREYLLCFVDFENILQSTICLNTLQGYRFDKHDKVGLKISYANESRDDKHYKWEDNAKLIISELDNLMLLHPLNLIKPS